MTTAVLLLGFGGPEQPEDVRPFIENVATGRNIPAQRINAVVDQYKEIGGASPFNKLIRQQAASLQIILSEKKHPMPVHIGLLYWQPYIKDVISQLTADGITQIITILMTVHRTEASYERYVKAVAQGADEVEKTQGRKPAIQFVDQFHVHPLFIEAASARVIDTLDQLMPHELDGARLIFTAHSVPQEMSDKSGYAEQINATASAVASRVRGKTGRALPWVVAYQSRSGPPNQPWLEPDIQHELAVSKKLGKTHVVVVPIGFISDHVEVLFDLDVLAARTAREMGMNMLRAPTVGDHPTFIRLLAELATDKADSFYAKPERQ